MKNKTKQLVKGTIQTYSLGDFLIRVKNCAMAQNKEVSVLTNKHITQVAEKMKKMGLFEDVKIDGSILTARLAFKDKKPIIMNLRLVSKPGLRIYKTVWDLEKKKGPSTYVISTPKGLVSLKEALKQRLGGEILVEIW